MSQRQKLTALLALALLLLILFAGGANAAGPSANVTTFATGLDNPRGLKFGPDGALYVAEGGKGGTDSTVGKCDQVPGPVGPYKGSKTGARISKIDSSGKVTTV